MLPASPPPAEAAEGNQSLSLDLNLDRRKGSALHGESSYYHFREGPVYPEARARPQQDDIDIETATSVAPSTPPSSPGNRKRKADMSLSDEERLDTN